MRTLVEIMPDYLIESHLAARNCGAYPHNGALRRVVDGDGSEYIMSAYDHAVREATDDDEREYEGGAK